MAQKDSYSQIHDSMSLKVLFFIFFGSAALGLIFIYRFYFWPFLFAMILYLAIRPLYDYIHRYIKRRSLSASIVIFLLIVLVLFPFFSLLVSIGDQAYQLYIYLEKQVNSGIITQLRESETYGIVLKYLQIDEGQLIRKATEYIQSAASNIVSSVTSIVSFPIAFFVNFFFTILILFFLFQDGNRLGRMFYKVLPFPDDIEKEIIDRLKDVIKVLLAGNLVIMILQGAMLAVGMYIAGLGIPLLWGSVGAILSLIPVIGTSPLWIPGAVYLLITGSYFSALFLVIWALFWYFFLENVVKPKVFGEKLNFHPLVFFFLLLGGIQAFGLPGVLLGPIILTLFYSLWEIYKLFNEIDVDNSDDNNENGDAVIEPPDSTS